MARITIELDNETYARLRRIVVTSGYWGDERELIVALIKDYIELVEATSRASDASLETLSPESVEADLMIRLAREARELDYQHPFIALLQSRYAKRRRRP